VDPIPGPPPVDNAAGKIEIRGAKFFRDGVLWLPVALSRDWAVQSKDNAAARAESDFFKSIGVDLHFAYSTPGIGKPEQVPNGSGPPYSDPARLVRNQAYWDEAMRRAEYHNANGQSLVVANFFADTHPRRSGGWSRQQLIDDWAKTIEAFKDFSVLYTPMGEYNEQGNEYKQLALQLIAITPAPNTLHPVGSSMEHHSVQSFISFRGWNPGAMANAMSSTGKPVWSVEDGQGMQDNVIQARFEDARRRGLTYVITGRNFPEWISENMRQWFRSLSNTQ
jgi:hypothetical protein